MSIVGARCSFHPDARRVQSQIRGYGPAARKLLCLIPGSVAAPVARLGNLCPRVRDRAHFVRELPVSFRVLAPRWMGCPYLRAPLILGYAACSPSTIRPITQIQRTSSLTTATLALFGVFPRSSRKVYSSIIKPTLANLRWRNR